MSTPYFEDWLSFSIQISSLQFALTAGAILAAARYAYRRFTSINLRDLRGPESKSFLAGNIIEIFEDSSTAARWQRLFGGIVRLQPQIFTGSAILVSDAAALRYIHQSEYSDRFIRAPEWYAMANLLAGDSIGSAEGGVHKRHRKGIRSAFGVPETRALLPLCEKWETALTTEESIELNICEWFSRAALDGFGAVAFDYDFGGIENNPTPLAKAMPSVILETFGSPTAGQLAALSVFQYIPLSLVKWILNESPLPIFDHVRTTNKMSKQYLLEMIQERREMPDLGQRKDILSMILKAGMHNDINDRLTEDEIVSELRRVALRKEVHDTREKVGAREFSAQDLQGMPLLNAIIKEVLRFTPVIQTLFKEATQDDVLPLSQPIILKSGKTTHEVPVPKGTKIYSSIAAFNVNRDVWGEDADIFDPYRWIKDGSEGGTTSLGMYANLMTFSAGTKGCIAKLRKWKPLGWRFAILQMQNMLAELIDRFEFSFPEDAPVIIHANCMATCPMIEGEVHKGAQLPLVVKRAS
ncbi:cytochrome P450 [Flagelloscypha sp. PMI_526]|nr:cytochrome P450 [Flagelloscypha sp. PMI_526]